MANLLRGQVPFEAAGRALYLCYTTSEIAQIQTALGFRRPDPFQPDHVEEVDVPVMEKVGDKGGVRQKRDEKGPVFRLERKVIDAAERQARMISAFEACWMRPDPEASLIIFRIGLRQWEREKGTKLTDAGFDEIAQALGLGEINLLHMQAVAHGVYLNGQESDEGKAPAASASTT